MKENERKEKKRKEKKRKEKKRKEKKRKEKKRKEKKRKEKKRKEKSYAARRNNGNAHGGLNVTRGRVFFQDEPLAAGQGDGKSTPRRTPAI